MTDEERPLVESYEKDAREKEPGYTGDRLFDQIVFIAPLIRMSENQTMGGGKSYTYFFTPEFSYLLMKSGSSIGTGPTS